MINNLLYLLIVFIDSIVGDTCRSAVRNAISKIDDAIYRILPSVD